MKEWLVGLKLIVGGAQITIYYSYVYYIYMSCVKKVDLCNVK